MGFKRFVGTAALGIRRHSPEILMGVGVVSSVLAVVFAAKDQPKAVEAKEKYKSDMSFIEDAHEIGETAINQEYTDKDYANDKIIAKVNYAKNTVKAYKRSIIFETVALACFGGAFGILSARYAGAVAYGASMKAGWDAYREQVRKDQGAEKDLEYMTGAKKEKVKVTEIDENGKKHTKTIEQWCLDPNLEGLPWVSYSPYAIRITPEHNIWKNNGGNPMLMENQLKIIQNNLTTHLHMNGSLTLEHVLAGQNGLGYDLRDTNYNFDPNITRNIGWLDTKTEGQDRCVNLGCWDEEGNLNYFPGQCIILDLNCDGWIMGKLPVRPKSGQELIDACREDSRIEK